MFTPIVGALLEQVAVVAVVWWLAMMRLRGANFQPRGGRRTHAPDVDGATLAKQIEYHNTATYRLFEFFLKIALGVLGGSAYLFTQKVTVAQQEKLLRSGAWLLILAAIVLSAVLTVHQKSKIERWPRRYGWREPFYWAEFWFIQGMLIVAVGFLRLVPYLVSS